MIDLHIKTMLSTGGMSVYRLLKTIEESDIKYFSIVDKNHCLAYNLINLEDYPNLITGVSINTYYLGMPIDLIGYDVDVNIINEWYSETYTPLKVKWIEHDRAERLIKMLADKGYKVKEICQRYDKLGVTIKEIFADLINNYPNFIYDNERDFRIYGLNNPESEYYLDQTEYLPSIDEVVKLIKKAKGKVFLAHPFEYRSDVSKLLEMAIEKGFDGIEVYHASISVLNSQKLLKFAKATKMHASIGSGFVGDEEFIPLGVHFDESILEEDMFKWIFNR